MGRPSLFTQETADEICDRLSSGEPLAKICRDEHMPSYRTILQWEDDHEEFLRLSTRARRDGTHYLADESLLIVDEPLPDKDATVEVAHRKLKVDTRLRLIGKWNRKDYGDKQEHEHTGSVKVIAGQHDEDL